jgi:hypothetical protein
MRSDPPIHWQLQWQHIDTMMERLYAHNLGAGLLPWAEHNWRILTHAGFTCAASELHRMDSIVRAISLGHIHFTFNHLCWQQTFEPDYARPLHPYIDPAQVARLAADRYVDASDLPDHASDCIDCALRCVVPIQSQQNFAVLKKYYGSTDDVCDNMLEYLTSGTSGPFVSDVAGVYAAYDLFRSITCDRVLEDGPESS